MEEKSGLQRLVEHPVAMGAGLSAIGFLAKQLNLHEIHPSLFLDEGIVLFAGYTGYLFSGLMHDYWFRERRTFSLENRVLSAIQNHPKLLALGGSVLGALSYYTVAPGYAHDPIATRMVITGGIAAGGIVAEALPIAISTVSRLRASPASRNPLVRLNDFIFENPYLVGIALAANHYLSKTEVYQTATKQIALGISSLLVGIIGTYATILAGGLLHSDSVKSNVLRLRREYFRLRGEVSRTISEQRKLVARASTKETRVRELVRLGGLYLDTARKDDAFRAYRLALRASTHKGDGLNHFELLSRPFRRRRTGNREHDLIIGVLNGDRDAVSKVSEGIESCDDPARLYLYGKAQEAAGYTEQGNSLKLRALEKLLAQGRLTKIPGKTRNTVSIFEGDPFFNLEVIVKSSHDRRKLEREAERNRQIRHVLRYKDGFDAPLPIGIAEAEGLAHLFMEFEPGEAVYSRLNSFQNSKDLEAAIEALSLIYSAIPIGSTTEPERNPVHYLDSALNVGAAMKSNLLSAADLLYRVTSPIPRVIYKDAQPKNLLVTEHGNLVILDNEGDRPTALTNEAADLIDYFPVLDRDTRFELAETMFRDYSRRTKTSYHKTRFLLGYLCSRLLRTVERIPYLLPEPGLHPLFVKQLDDARETVHELRDRFNPFYVESSILFGLFESSLHALADQVRIPQA